nr:MAG TPA: hypothetical protein [Bacteriophage sp.]
MSFNTFIRFSRFLRRSNFLLNRKKITEGKRVLYIQFISFGAPSVVI